MREEATTLGCQGTGAPQRHHLGGGTFGTVSANRRGGRAIRWRFGAGGNRGDRGRGLVTVGGYLLRGYGLLSIALVHDRMPLTRMHRAGLDGSTLRILPLLHIEQSADYPYERQCEHYGAQHLRMPQEVTREGSYNVIIGVRGRDVRQLGHYARCDEIVQIE